MYLGKRCQVISSLAHVVTDVVVDCWKFEISHPKQEEHLVRESIRNFCSRRDLLNFHKLSWYHVFGIREKVEAHRLLWERSIRNKQISPPHTYNNCQNFLACVNSQSILPTQGIFQAFYRHSHGFEVELKTTRNIASKSAETLVSPCALLISLAFNWDTTFLRSNANYEVFSLLSPHFRVPLPHWREWSF